MAKTCRSNPDKPR